MDGKAAIVTGSNGGIGTGIATILASEGAPVNVTGRRIEKGQGVVDSITSQGGKASFHPLDISDTASMEALIADTAEQYGRSTSL